jgi:hypothetical protein
MWTQPRTVRPLISAGCAAVVLTRCSACAVSTRTSRPPSALAATAIRSATRNASAPEHRLFARRRVVGERLPHAGRELSVVGHYDPEGVCHSRIAAANCSGASEGTKWPAPLTMTVW